MNPIEMIEKMMRPDPPELRDAHEQMRVIAKAARAQRDQKEIHTFNVIARAENPCKALSVLKSFHEFVEGLSGLSEESLRTIANMAAMVIDKQADLEAKALELAKETEALIKARTPAPEAAPAS